MNILFFTELSPFPINGGEMIRSYGLIKALSELGHKVEAIISNSENVALDDFYLKNVNYRVINTINLTFIDRILGLFYYRKNKMIIETFNKVCSINKPDIAFIDYGYSGQYISYFKDKKIPVIYGTHNAQSNLTQQKPSSGLLLFLRKWQLFILERIHENYFFPKADLLLTVSNSDKQFYSRIIDKEKIEIVPNYLDESRYAISHKKEEYIVMTANFNAYMNKAGLNWLITEIWDKDLDNNVSLMLVGKGSKEAFEKINVLYSYKNIKAIGAVDDIIPYISKAKAVIIPLLHGSGTRLKCLEAMALKTLIISTSKGVEGINSNHLIIADTPNKFKNCILSVKDDENTSQGLYDDFIKNYSLKNNKELINRILEKTFAIKAN